MQRDLYPERGYRIGSDLTELAFRGEVSLAEVFEKWLDENKGSIGLTDEDKRKIDNDLTCWFRAADNDPDVPRRKVGSDLWRRARALEHMLDTEERDIRYAEECAGSLEIEKARKYIQEGIIPDLFARKEKIHTGPLTEELCDNLAFILSAYRIEGLMQDKDGLPSVISIEVRDAFASFSARISSHGRRRRLLFKGLNDENSMRRADSILPFERLLNDLDGVLGSEDVRRLWDEGSHDAASKISSILNGCLGRAALERFFGSEEWKDEYKKRQQKKIRDWAEDIIYLHSLSTDPSGHIAGLKRRREVLCAVTGSDLPDIT